MNQDQFAEDRKIAWETLESLLTRASGGGIVNMSASEIRLLGSLYRKASSDLSYSRSRGYDQELVQYLNSLVRKAYGVIYLKDKGKRGNLFRFFFSDYPALIRKNIRYILLSVIVFVFFALLGYFWSMADSRFARWAAPPQFLEIWDRSDKDTDQYDRGQQDEDMAAFPAMSSWYLVNNFKVGLYSFGTGMFLGIGTLFFMGYNGLILGAILALAVKADYSGVFFNFVLSHSFVELWAIFICGGAGFMIAESIVFPGDLSLKDSISRKGADAIKMAVGTAPLFLLAGIIEASYSRLDYSNLYKGLFGFATVLAMIWYFLSGYGQKKEKAYRIEEKIS